MYNYIEQDFASILIFLLADFKAKKKRILDQFVASILVFYWQILRLNV